MREKIEQVAVYGSLLVMLSLLILFGISTAEKGVNSLVGQPNAPLQANVQAVKTYTTTPSEPRILGKNITTTEPPWSQQLSHSLESQNSPVATLMDQTSLAIGSLLHGGAQTLLSGLDGLFE